MAHFSDLAACAVAWYTDAERYNGRRRMWRRNRGGRLEALARHAWEGGWK